MFVVGLRMPKEITRSDLWKTLATLWADLVRAWRGSICNSYNCKLFISIQCIPFWSGFLLCQVLLYRIFLFCVAFPGVCLGRMTRFFLKATPAASSCWLRPLGGYDHRLATPSRRHRSHESQNMTLVVSAGSSQKVSVTALAVEFDEIY